jgi:hypothetical protein
MERRSDPIDCEGKNRIGHEFYSCQFEPFNETGFSRWGVKGGPQGLKPVSHARFDGTTTSRALPSRGVGPMQWCWPNAMVGSFNRKRQVSRLHEPTRKRVDLLRSK